MAKTVNARTLPVQSIGYKYGKLIIPPYEVDVEFTPQEEAALNSGITADMIPSTAGANNPLTDKQYVDNAVAVESDFQTNLAAIMSLAVDPNAGVTIVTTNPEWKLVYTDANANILLGKRQDNTWYFAADLDTILDTIINGYVNP